MDKSKLLQDLKPREVKEAINDYEFTCHTIITIENIIKRNIGGKCSQGKKLMTSSKNVIQPNTEVTPDIVIEVDGAKGYRAVNEIAVNLPKDQDRWLKKASQLKKYDDELNGWNFTSDKKHDIMFTTNELRTYSFDKYMQQLSSEGKLSIERNFSILHSTPMELENSFIAIKKDSGIISDVALDTVFSEGKGVARHNMVNEINQMKFFDHNPPILYTMMIIWDHVLKTFLTLKEIRDLKGNKIIPITITVNEVHDKLSKFAPETNPTCIEHSWVKTALLGFVEIGLAELKNESEGKFEMKFRTHKGKTLNWLFEKIEKPEKVEKPSKTLDEFISTGTKKEESKNTD